MLRAIGDIHGQNHHYWQLTNAADLEGIKTIQVGDLSYDYNKTFKTPNHEVSNNHYFFGGNHDNYQTINDQPQCLGDHGHLEHLGHPDVYYVRGAMSIDKIHRTEGVTWFHNEELNYDTMNLIMSIWETRRPRVLITHDCAATEQWRLTTPPYKPSRTANLISTMFSVHVPEIHVFGHYHVPLNEIVNINNRKVRLVCLCADPRFSSQIQTFDIGEP